MTLYTRHQILLVLVIVGAAGAGLAIDHWRRASPDVVERLERFDRTERADAPVPVVREPRDSPRATRRRTDAAADRERTAPLRPPRGHPTREVAPGEARTARGPRRPTVTPEAPLDVNRAAAPELARLPGIGRALAARIVEARPFASLDDLARVRGLRRATLERVRSLLVPPP